MTAFERDLTTKAAENLLFLEDVVFNKLMDKETGKVLDSAKKA